MIVKAERGGGIAGNANHELLGSVDTEHDPQGARIEELVRDVDFFSLPPQVGESHVYDAMWTRVTVEQGGTSPHSVSFDDGSDPPAQLTEIVALVRGSHDAAGA